MAIEKARGLRRKATEAERLLWKALRGRQFSGYKFRRQHPIEKFIVDFACIEHQLIIEADGGQHAENWADACRTARLEREGWRVVRFWNNDIIANTEGVMAVILSNLSNRNTLTLPSAERLGPSLSRKTGEGK
ncbi:MAG: endonuclease domain-containing protein [Alphaproteobacteria bacterium]|nr:endonuclease domain-containing protein [Alphaproteobacteria bacterium]